MAAAAAGAIVGYICPSGIRSPFGATAAIGIGAGVATIAYCCRADEG